MKNIDRCRVCGSQSLRLVMDLGRQPLANSLVRTQGQPEAIYPLTLAFCTTCTLVQIMETVEPEALFRDYPYFSSVSPAIVENARLIAERTIDERNLRTGKRLVVEAASNDGYLLKHYKRWGVPVLGVDPAENVAKVARENGVQTWCEFFGTAVAHDIVSLHGQADVFHANNVLAHVADQNDFVEGIRILLKPDGVAILEFPYLGRMVEDVEFDTVYHEHLCYFSLRSVMFLLNSHGLVVEDVARIPIHGGSLRVWASHLGKESVGSSTWAVLDQESRAGMGGWDYYQGFAARANRLGIDLWQTLYGLKQEGFRLVGYGASAKGSTLLNYFGLGPLLDYVVDRSPHKQGLYTPGTQLPIRDPKVLLEEGPIIHRALLLTWNFRDEIVAQNREFIERGGRFVVPIPRIEVVSS